MLASAETRVFQRHGWVLRRLFQTCHGSKQHVELSAALDGEKSDFEYEAARPYESIPGPKPLPIPYAGNLWRLLPFGTYGNMELPDIMKRLHQQYGPIVKFDGLVNFNYVALSSPQYVEKVFRNDSTYPLRFALESIKYYREVYRKDYFGEHAGLFISNGPKWHEFRTTSNKVMLSPKNVVTFLKYVDEVCDDFLERIRCIRQPNHEMPSDFFVEINKMTLETMMYLGLDKRLGCLTNNLEANSEAMGMINAVRNSFVLLEELNLRPSLWKLYPTKKWKKFVESMDYTVEFTKKYVSAKWEEIKNLKDVNDSENRSILENLLLTAKDPKIPVVMVSDMIFAGIDTTSSCIGTALYLLATNPDKQNKLFEEVKRLLPQKNSPMTNDALNELKYTRAVIKETIRLHPPASGNQRKTSKNLVIENYQIPKGTIMLMNNGLMCRFDEHFKNPNDFIPERWLKSERQSGFSYKEVHPFTYLPFGFGQRSCIGKRLAYLEIDVNVAKIIRNFELSYEHEPMTWSSKLITIPAKPLKFKVMDRPE